MATHAKVSVWTYEREKALMHLWSSGMSIQAISDALGVARASTVSKAWSLGLPDIPSVPRARPSRSKAALAARAAAMPNRPVKTQSKAIPVRMTGTGRIMSVEEQDKARMSDLKRASILHLVDLKRAGHSPRTTEQPVLCRQYAEMSA